MESNPVTKNTILLKYSYELRNADVDSALSCIRIAYKSAIDLKNEALQGEAAVQFAICEEMQSNHKVALKYFFLATNLFRKVKDDEGLSKCYTGMGVAYWYQGLYTQAIDYFNKNIEISRRLKDAHGLAVSYGNLAIIFDEKGQLDSSLAYYNKALNIFLKEGEPREIASCYDNMSLIYLQKKEFDRALDFHEKGYALRRQVADTFGIMASMENLGNIHIKQHKPEKAIEVSLQVLQLAKRMGAREDMKYAFANLRDAYEQKSDFKTAFFYQGQLMALKDSLRNEENINNTVELEARFRSKEKDAELNEIKLEQKLREEQVENENKRKNLLIVILMVGGGSFLLIAFLIFRRFKEKQKIANELKSKNEAISAQKILIDQAYAELAEKNKDITDSIRYAQRIQEAFFPHPDLWSKILPDSFVLFKPKDIVSGDFYWMEKQDDCVYLAVVDCTGHGVPGAFMSIVGFNLLTKAIHENKKNSPADILNQMNVDLYDTLRQTMEESKVKDGMEISLLKWDQKNQKLIFASANHVVYLVKNGRLQVLKGDNHSIGAFYGERLKKFTEQTLSVDKGDCFYLTSDGYPDQFGGPKGKKFKYKQLEKTILEISGEHMKKQGEHLDKVFHEWKGSLEQIDDVCIIGLRL